VNPFLCVVHDEPAVRDLFVRDAEERFAAQYTIEAHTDAVVALAALRRHAALGWPVAAVFAANSSSCADSAFWAEVHALHPGARRVLLLGRGQWDQAHPAVEAMRSGDAESYIFVPWVLRERWLYLPMTEILADWEASQPPPTEVVALVGDEWEPRTHALRDWLSRIGLPFGFYSSGSAQASRVLAEAGVDRGPRPVLSFRSGTVLVDPTYEAVATTLGFATDPETDHCDVAIVGAGPAGLAAAVYGASEGLSTIVIDEDLPGGQAGTSSRIRNYLGFPTGVSGRDLTNRALEQAWFFGARFVLSKRVTAIRPAGLEHVVELAGARPVKARTVIIATGVAWRRLGVPALEALSGAGVFYGAVSTEAGRAEGANIFIIGAGNSAGQAAVHLARRAASVTLVVRGDRLGATMSDYLIRELDQTPNIRVRLLTEVVDGVGEGRLTAVVLRDRAGGSTDVAAADALYVMIGARPHTDWLAGTLARDADGYILTGPDLAPGQEGGEWPLTRPPMLQETSVPGIFAAGDVRHGSVKRVASAVGAGSIAVQLAHLRLAELSAAIPLPS
jgi:thioredoxin reductase (NADPH)